MRDPIAQPLGHDFGVFREPIGAFPVQPTTFLEDLGGEIPVVQRDPRVMLFASKVSISRS